MIADGLYSYLYMGQQTLWTLPQLIAFIAEKELLMPPGADVPAGCELWFVVQSRPRQELLAATAIEVRTHLDVFVPEVLEARQGRKVPKPLFPGYLFVRTEPAMLPVRTINKTPGVLRIVGFDGIPRAVETDVVTALRARCQAINADGGLPRHGFKPGDAVRLTEGPLAGLEGIFQGPMTPAERVEVLLTFMRRAQSVQVPPEHLERVANPIEPQPQRPPRRTRGRGRRIKPKDQ